jgi:hypothetical protein
MHNLRPAPEPNKPVYLEEDLADLTIPLGQIIKPDTLMGRAQLQALLLHILHAQKFSLLQEQEKELLLKLEQTQLEVAIQKKHNKIQRIKKIIKAIKVKKFLCHNNTDKATELKNLEKLEKEKEQEHKREEKIKKAFHAFLHYLNNHLEHTEPSALLTHQFDKYREHYKQKNQELNLSLNSELNTEQNVRSRRL